MCVYKKILMLIDCGLIFMVVYGVFSEVMIEGIWYNFDFVDIGFIVVIDVVFFVIMLMIIMFGSCKFGFFCEDEIVIIFCGLKKSLVLGVFMVNVIFVG